MPGLAFLALYGLGLTACFQHLPELPLSSAFVSPGANQPVVLRLALIGDTGDPEPQEAVLRTLSAWTELSPVTTVMIFLGDTIYDRGLPPSTDPNRPEAERRLMRQLTMIKHSRDTRSLFPETMIGPKARRTASTACGT